MVLSRWCFGARHHKETELAEQIEARALQLHNLQREHAWLQGEHDKLAAAHDRLIIRGSRDDCDPCAGCRCLEELGQQKDTLRAQSLEIMRLMDNGAAQAGVIQELEASITKQVAMACSEAGLLAHEVRLQGPVGLQAWYWHGTNDMHPGHPRLYPKVRLTQERERDTIALHADQLADSQHEVPPTQSTCLSHALSRPPLQLAEREAELQAVGQRCREQEAQAASQESQAASQEAQLAQRAERVAELEAMVRRLEEECGSERAHGARHGARAATVEAELWEQGEAAREEVWEARDGRGGVGS